jgi:DNA-dependent protein kinase catalytic subunit
VVKKSTQTPRISKLYTLLKTILMVCSKLKYFEKPITFDTTGLDWHQIAQNKQRHAQMESERLNTFNMLLTYLKELIGKSEEF